MNIIKNYFLQHQKKMQLVSIFIGVLIILFLLVTKLQAQPQSEQIQKISIDQKPIEKEQWVKPQEVYSGNETLIGILDGSLFADDVSSLIVMVAIIGGMFGILTVVAGTLRKSIY